MQTTNMELVSTKGLPMSSKLPVEEDTFSEKALKGHFSFRRMCFYAALLFSALTAHLASTWVLTFFAIQMAAICALYYTGDK